MCGCYEPKCEREQFKSILKHQLKNANIFSTLIAVKWTIIASSIHKLS